MKNTTTFGNAARGRSCTMGGAFKVFTKEGVRIVRPGQTPSNQ